MAFMKSLLKKLLPEKIIGLYHLALAYAAVVYYRFPSKKMIVVGITGTKGKTSSANFIWAALNSGGYKTGIIGTANIRIGEKEFLNSYHMTMPGRFTLQKILSQMAKEGCRVCVVETTSEGIKQSRHKGIMYDIAVFTNLFPEHLASHEGSFDEYKKAKGILFASLEHAPKIINGKPIETLIVANYDSPEKDYFLGFPASKKITYGMHHGADVVAEHVANTDYGISFTVRENNYRLNLPGVFNVYNAIPAITIALHFSVPPTSIQQGFNLLRVIPGRMERIQEGQSFEVIVDYAHEKQSMTLALDTAHAMAKNSSQKVIVLLGAEGGGRDKTKRPEMGAVAGAKANYVIISNVDPYDDDPKEIMEDIARSAESAGKIRGQNLFVIEDRHEGIRKALSLGREGDVVLITGKGAEQSMVIKNKHIPWDDRVVVREELKNLIKQ